MSSTRDFFASTVADGMIPYLRRPVEDIIYETLDHRQVPTRTDFRELRDLVNSLRGQLTGATGGVRKLAEQVEALEEQLDEAGPGGSESALAAIREDVAGLAAALERVTRLAQAVDGLSNQLGELEAAHSQRLSDLEAKFATLDNKLDALGEESNDADSMLQDEISALAEASKAADEALATEIAGVEAEADAEIAEVERKLAKTKAAPKKAAPKKAAPKKAAAKKAVVVDKGTCRVPDCGRNVRAKGFCSKHYQRWRRGTLEGFPLDA